MRGVVRYVQGRPEDVDGWGTNDEAIVQLALNVDKNLTVADKLIWERIFLGAGDEGREREGEISYWDGEYGARETTLQ